MTKTQTFTINEAAEYILPLLVWVILFFMIFLALVNSLFGIENSGTLYLFEPDGAFAVRQLQLSLKMDELNPWGHYNYGMIYNSVGFIILKAASFFGYNVQQVPFIAYTLRCISIVSYALTVLIFYLILRKFQISSGLSSVFTLFLASLPEFYRHAQLIHPDVLTLVFIIGAIFVIVIRQDLAGLLLSTLLAGLAFGTKYTGIFILPFLPIPYTYGLLRSNRKISSKIAKILSTGTLVIILFFLTWLFTNPSVLTNYEEFVKDISSEHSRLTDIYGKALANRPLSWFPILHDEFSLSGTVILLAGFGCGIASLYLLWKTKPTHLWDRLTLKKPFAPQTIILVFIVSYTLITFSYFLVTISARGVRYIFHIIPCILLLSSLGFRWMYKAYIPPKWRAILSCGLLVLVMTISMRTMHASSVLSTKQNNDFIVASKWLTRNYPPSVKILYELHGYISQEYFQHFRLVEYITEEPITAFDPDIIIFNQNTFGQWSGRQKRTTKDSGYGISDSFVTGDKEMIAFRQTFCSPENPQWKIVYEADSLVILEKRQKK